MQSSRVNVHDVGAQQNLKEEEEKPEARSSLHNYFAQLLPSCEEFFLLPFQHLYLCSSTFVAMCLTLLHKLKKLTVMPFLYYDISTCNYTYQMQVTPDFQSTVLFLVLTL